MHGIHHYFGKEPEFKRIKDKYAHAASMPVDDFLSNLSEGGRGVAFSDSLKQYKRLQKTRSHRHSAFYANGERDKCRTHGKRRCCDMNVCDDGELLASERKRAEKRRRVKRSRTERASRPRDRVQTYAISSSEDDCVEVTNRDVLRVALNIKSVESDELGQSTLSHKLSAIRSRSNDRNERERYARERSHKSSSEGELNLGEKKKKKKKKTRQRTRSVGGKENDFFESGDENDDAVSLEEQELRLIALKSAVMKKHEARKKRQMAMSIRPYSPTDSLLTPTGEDNADQTNCLDSMDVEDNNNMDISSASSPQSMQCQPMDMELASDDSKSPVFFYQKSITYPPSETWNWMCGVPLNANNYLIEESMSYMKFMVPSPLEVPGDRKQAAPAPAIQSENDDELELRAQLIATMKANKMPAAPQRVVKAADGPSVNEELNQDESLEADCLRSLLLSSIRQKKESKHQMDSSKSPAAVPERLKPIDQMLSMPKITSNLKEAVRRLQQKELLAAEVAKTDIPEAEIEANAVESVKESIGSGPLANEKPIQDAIIFESPKNETKITPSNPQARKTAVATKRAAPQPKVVESGEKILIKSIATQNQTPFAKLSGSQIPIKSKNTPNSVVNVMPTIAMKPTHVAMKATAAKPDGAKKSTLNIPDWQPVKKLIIMLNGSESSTDFDDDEEGDSKENDLDAMRSSTPTDAIRAFDNASPASILMDSPSFSPFDGETLQMPADDNQSTEEPKAAAEERPKTDAFQMKLDEYLKTVRAKTETEPNHESAAKSGENIKAEPATKVIMKPTSTTSAPKNIINLKQKTPNVSCWSSSSREIFHQPNKTIIFSFRLFAICQFRRNWNTVVS